MTDKATTPTGETRYRHVTSSQQRLMATQRWEATVKRQKAEQEKEIQDERMETREVSEVRCDAVLPQVRETSVRPVRQTLRRSRSYSPSLCGTRERGDELDFEERVKRLELSERVACWEECGGCVICRERWVV